MPDTIELREIWIRHDDGWHVRVETLDGTVLTRRLEPLHTPEGAP